MAVDWKPLEPPDSHHLNAAQGWLELGNWREASTELERVAASLKEHPAVLEVRWSVCAAAEQWESAVEAACATTRLLPEMPYGWVHWAYALRRLKGIPEAREILMSVVEKFPKEPIIRYNLACYACQLGDLKAARQWLDQAIALGGRQNIRAMALKDPDLEPLRKEIGET
jgi:predicted Zn-dependent protease